ncbi:cupin domain-containing protein [Polymorphum gilvum]|uniref:Transcriptional regulator n=1 Tax=Polymorphum gilvum (strain LMG 25793 / CGMCC 1.9160 / SL003B-26A1) TaxID=991905 RepID=F2J6W6_POLGS|nr:cupin domain-containing protein [Polymorphum gilvum]ADZ72599.1 Transcriptional regulator [Polymorphum gilvum SL003B-26A1]
MSAVFLPFDLDAVTPEEDAPAPDRVLAGDPRFTTWLVEARDGDTLFAGVWQATPGKWRISYDEWEFCSILSGRSVVTGADGVARELKPGDSFVLRPGFSGTWEVLETTRKLFVIRLYP